MEAELPKADPPKRRTPLVSVPPADAIRGRHAAGRADGLCRRAVKVVRERKAWLSTIRDRGGNVVTVQMVGLYFKPREPISSFREWLGDIAIQGMQLPTDTKADDVDRIKITFPESDITLRPNDPRIRRAKNLGHTSPPHFQCCTRS